MTSRGSLGDENDPWSSCGATSGCSKPTSRRGSNQIRATGEAIISDVFFCRESKHPVSLMSFGLACTHCSQCEITKCHLTSVNGRPTTRQSYHCYHSCIHVSNPLLAYDSLQNFITLILIFSTIYSVWAHFLLVMAVYEM